MTKTLTEQWKNGELPEGEYFAITTWSDEIRPLSFYGDCFLDTEVPLDNSVIVEVLAPVPSYDKVKEMSQKIERLEFDNEVLDNELKELATKNDTLAMENGRLTEQLEIATKALKYYDGLENIIIDWKFLTGQEAGTARKALKEMEGVK